MADHLTAAEIAMIDAIVDPIRRERAAAPGLAAKYDSACDAVTDQYDEIVRLRRQVEALEDQLRDRDGRLRAQLAALPAPHQAPPVQHIDIYESSYYDVAAALDAAAEDREPITVTTCNGTVTTYRAVPLDTRPHRAEGQQATETKETDETRPM